MAWWTRLRASSSLITTRTAPASSWRASFEDGVGIVDPHPIAEQKRYLEDTVLPHHEVRLALVDRELVGFVAADSASVAQFYVRPGFQRRGIGRTLPPPG